MSDSERGQVNASAAEVYEAFFLPALFEQFAVPLLEAADVSRGDRVLDVGCGTGVVARRAVEHVGADGQVVGLDANDGMLAVARRSPDVQWIAGMAEALPFPDGSFDVVVCQFALMFFEDRIGALREMRRVLRSGGRVGIATWASLGATPGYAAMVSLLDRLFGRESGDALRAPFTLGEGSVLRELVAAVFPGVQVREQPGTARFESIEAWVRTDIRGWTLSGMPEDDYQTLLAAAQTELARFTDPSGRVGFSAPALVATADVAS